MPGVLARKSDFVRGRGGRRVRVVSRRRISSPSRRSEWSTFTERRRSNSGKRLRTGDNEAANIQSMDQPAQAMAPKICGGSARRSMHAQCTLRFGVRIQPRCPAAPGGQCTLNAHCDSEYESGRGARRRPAVNARSMHTAIRSTNSAAVPRCRRRIVRGRTQVLSSARMAILSTF